LLPSVRTPRPPLAVLHGVGLQGEDEVLHRGDADAGDGEEHESQRPDRRLGEGDAGGPGRRDDAGGHIRALLAEGPDDPGDHRGDHEYAADAEDRQDDLEVGAPEHVSGVVHLQRLQGEHAGQHEQGAEAQQHQGPVVPDCAEALLEAHRGGVAFHRLPGGPEAEQVERDAGGGEDQGGDGQ
jgi:hypothetical protein